MKCNISKKMRKIPQNTEGVFTACLALNTPSLLLVRCFTLYFQSISQGFAPLFRTMKKVLPML